MDKEKLLEQILELFAQLPDSEDQVAPQPEEMPVEGVEPAQDKILG